MTSTIAGSDNATEPGPPSARWRGNLDVVQRSQIEGWAQDERFPDAAVVLQVFDNGVPLGSVVADEYREDLEAAGIGKGRHAFYLTVPGGLSPEIRHLIDVRHADGRVLPGSPMVLEAAADSVTVITRSALAAPWKGLIETVTRERLEGWAWDDRTPEKPLALVVVDNGVVIARMLANRYRRDLAHAGIGAGRHSFALHIPGGLSPLVRHVIQVLGEADGCEMPSSPVIVEASTTFDAALEHTVLAAVTSLSSAEERSRVLGVLAASVETLLQQNAAADASLEARLIHRQFERRWGSISTPERDAAAALVPSSAPRALRALVVDDRVPMIGETADGGAVLSHMRALVTLGYEVSFVAADELRPAAEVATAFAAQGIHLCRAPYYGSVEEVLRRQYSGFDLILLHRVSNAARYLTLARQSGSRTRIAYVVNELHHLRLARQAKIERRPELLGQSHRVRFTECAAASAADLVIVHSAVEAAWLRQAVRGANVHVVPWVVPVGGPISAWTSRRGVAFVGDFGTASDVDAAHYLIDELMPLVWRTNPDIECRLAGRRVSAEIERLGASKVTITSSTTKLLDEIRLTVAPLRFGAGIKHAVLESFAAGVPCILTPLAAEGISLPASLPVIGRDAAEMAAQIVRSHEDATTAHLWSVAAQAFIRDNFSSEIVAEKMRGALLSRTSPDSQASVTVIGART